MIKAGNFWHTPVVKIVVSQGIASALTFLVLVPLAGKFNIFLQILIWLWGLGAVAAVIGWRLGLGRWWAVLQVSFPFAMATALKLELPAYVWLAVFVLTVLVFWNSFRGRVPLYLSNRTTWSALDRALPDKSGLRFIDLGGGVGGTSLYLARRHVGGTFISLESAPVPYAISWLRKAMSGQSNVKMMYGDIWQQSLESFDVVYAFLSPQPMEQLYGKAINEMRQGSMFISNTFQVPGQDAHDIIELDDARRTRLHVWRF